MWRNRNLNTTETNTENTSTDDDTSSGEAKTQDEIAAENLLSTIVIQPGSNDLFIDPDETIAYRDCCPAWNVY